MARAIERIEQDIAVIEEAIALLAADFYQAYETYLNALGQAVRQQLILVSYHLCTQGYPETFLKLSFSDRQQLQQDLRHIAAQTQEELTLHLTKLESVKTPEDLASWYEELEQEIGFSLQSLSRQANRLIQQRDILPKKFPDVLLEAASKAEGASEVMAGPPNLLNVLIEAENADESEDSTITHLMAIHLRLSEIEFADSTSMAGRTQLRNLASRLNSLRREYQKKRRERTIAEAEAAWRSSWFEDNI